MKSSRRVAGAALFLLGACAPALAQQDYEAALKSQTFRIIVGSPPGGSYDLYARAVARHIGRHLPGQPSVVVQNMPGGGGYAAANHLAAAAPKDGTTMAVFSRSVPMQPLIDPTGVHFDPKTLAWIGSPSDEVGVTLSSTAGPVKNLADLKAKGMTVAATGPGTDSNVYARVVGRLLKTNIRLVTGYMGAADMLLALERNEVEGIGGVSWSSVWPGKKDQLEGQRIVPLLQLGRAGSHDLLKGVPTIAELVTDKDDREVLEVVFARQVMAFPFAAPPGTPADRLATLRAAFEATVADPQFIAEAKATGISVNPVKAAEMEGIIRQVYASPPALVARVKAIMDGGK